MQKKEIFSLLILLVVGIAFFLVFKYSKLPLVYEVTGAVVEVRDGLIRVEGLVGSKIKTIDFIINEDTLLNKAALVISREQMAKPGKFAPEKRMEIGNVLELTLGKNIVAHSRDNLRFKRKALATQIDYAGYSWPKRE